MKSLVSLSTWIIDIKSDGHHKECAPSIDRSGVKMVTDMGVSVADLLNRA